MFAVNFYDSMPLNGETPAYVTFFGATQVGNIFQTNLMCAGMFSSDETVVARFWYARTNIGRQHQWWGAFERWSHETVVRFRVGDRPLWTSSLYDLVNRWRSGDDEGDTAAPMPWPLIVPVRQSVAAEVQCSMSWRLAMEITGQEKATDFSDDPNHVAHPRLWLHVGGVRCEPGQAEKVVQSILQTPKVATVTDQIAMWLMGQSHDAEKRDDRDTAAQLAALADGVSDGRWMGGVVTGDTRARKTPSPDATTALIFRTPTAGSDFWVELPQPRRSADYVVIGSVPGRPFIGVLVDHRTRMEFHFATTERLDSGVEVHFAVTTPQ